MELKDKKGLTLQQFLKEYKTKNYNRPYLTADCLIICQKEDSLYILLVKRKGHPFIQQWAIPGGFAQENETLDQTATRELKEETNLSTNVILLANYSQPQRDPRGWVVSAAYYGHVDKEKAKPKAGDDASQTSWFKIEIKNEEISLTNEETTIIFDKNYQYITTEQLAFDHQKMITDLLKKLNYFQ